MKCWMLCEPDGEDARPIWGDNVDAAIASTKEWDVDATGWIVTRIPAWDGKKPDDITKLDWYVLDEGFGLPCAVCNSIVFAETCSVWWTIDGEPLHGPGWDWLDCYLQVSGMPMDVFVLLEFERKEKARIYAAWREINRRAGRCFEDREALTEMFITATGKTPEEYLGVEAAK